MRHNESWEDCGPILIIDGQRIMDYRIDAERRVRDAIQEVYGDGEDDDAETPPRNSNPYEKALQQDQERHDRKVAEGKAQQRRDKKRNLRRR